MLACARIMPAGKCTDRLEAALGEMFNKDPADRILAFDAAAAPLYAGILVARRELGHSISQFDAQMVAITRLHGASLATRNVADFQECGIRIVNPWGTP